MIAATAFATKSKHSLFLLVLNCYFICSLFGLTLSAKAAGSEAPSVVEFSSCTVHSSYELVGATYMMMHMGGGSFMSHKASYNSTWAPGATNNLAVNLTYTFQMADPVLFNMMSPEDQDMYMQNTNNFSEGVSTNSTASSPLTTPEYRSTFYALNAQHDDITSNLRLQTKGYTNSAASSVFKITVSAYNLLRDSNGILVDTAPIDPGEIEILGLTPNASGIVYKVLADNTAVDVTPIINQTTYSNYIFYLEAERVKISLTIANTGDLVKPDNEPTIGEGIDASAWLAFVASSGSQLGVNSFSSSGKIEFNNGIQISGQLPNDADLLTNLAWHREINVSRYYWNPNFPNVFSDVWGVKNFDTDTPYNPAGTGNDSGGGSVDSSPDANQMIFSADSPNLDVTSIDLLAPLGSIAALRFSAREWATWNGAIISNVAKWHSFITIKKVGPVPAWTRVGINEIGSGEDTSQFTIIEAQGL